MKLGRAKSFVRKLTGGPRSPLKTCIFLALPMMAAAVHCPIVVPATTSGKPESRADIARLCSLQEMTMRLTSDYEVVVSTTQLASRRIGLFAETR
jgi:hypothetical protein